MGAHRQNEATCATRIHHIHVGCAQLHTWTLMGLSKRRLLACGDGLLETRHVRGGGYRQVLH